MTTYYSAFMNIRDKLKQELNEITWLSGRIDVNTWKTDTVFPRVLIIPDVDNMESEKIHPPIYKLQPLFNVIFRANTDDIDIVVSGVGAIIDKIRDNSTAYTNTSGTIWEAIKVGTVDYKYASPGVPNKIIREASVSVTGITEWG